MQESNNLKLETIVSNNFSKIKLWWAIPLLLLLLFFFLFLVVFKNEASFVDAYVKIQKNLFFYLNDRLSVYPKLQYNLTQLGDATFLFPLVTIFIIYAPKLWEALLSASILSLLTSAILKKIFSVPRPAAILDNNSFTIIGKKLCGHTSLPSGHSICIFILITILLFAFMPKTNRSKIIWSLIIISLGLTIAFSRVAVGAHYPLDVLIGSIIGFILAIIGIKISSKIKLFSKMNNKYYPIFIVILIIWAGLIVKKIIAFNLVIFYISFLSLLITLYLMTSSYVKKNK